MPDENRYPLLNVSHPQIILLHGYRILFTWFIPVKLSYRFLKSPGVKVNPQDQGKFSKSKAFKKLDFEEKKRTQVSDGKITEREKDYEKQHGKSTTT